VGDSELVDARGAGAGAGEPVVACVADQDRAECDQGQEDHHGAHGINCLSEDFLPPVAVMTGFSIQVDEGLDRVAAADLVAVPAMPRGGVAPEPIREALLAAHERGARILSVCSGAFTLGAVGLLDGRECTTHWMYTDDLQRRFPLARVVPEVLYVDAGQVVTSAGSAAGLDAALHIWRQEYGAAVASMVARRADVPPHRDGVETLARRVHMSPRTFARRFRDETGSTPHNWVTRQRVAAAEELLETSEQPVEWIATEVGFANAAILRHHFTRARGVSPQQYRRAFCPSPEGAVGAAG
jgi:transcriptional regulator GlxA family with amidase domain